MNKIVTLGPAGTYSDIATKKYITEQKQPYQIEYFHSIKNTLRAIGHTADLCVLPIENLSEGYVSLVLDHLLEVDLFIVGEILLPIQFSLVSNASNLDEINKLYVQFVAKGQCSEFIDLLNDIEVVTTESNIESLNFAIEKEGLNAAVVPSNSFSANNFNLVVENINDYKNNQTRFLVFSSKENKIKKAKNGRYKTSIAVIDDNDHPGFLGDILSSFSMRKINLTSIISRPTREKFGKYHFFIDFDGHIEDRNIIEALNEIKTHHNVKVMGSYIKS